MRKIETAAEKERRQRRNQFVVGGVLIVLLVVSTLGYSLMSGRGASSSNKKKEDGVQFVRDHSLWKFVNSGSTFGLQNLPSDINNISVNISADISMYSEQPLYFVNPSQGMVEIINNLGSSILRYQDACLSNESCDGNFPVKDCSDNLVIFMPGNSTNVYQKDHCIYIVGDSIKGADAFLYNLLGII